MPKRTRYDSVGSQLDLARWVLHKLRVHETAIIPSDALYERHGRLAPKGLELADLLMRHFEAEVLYRVIPLKCGDVAVSVRYDTGLGVGTDERDRLGRDRKELVSKWVSGVLNADNN